MYLSAECVKPLSFSNLYFDILFLINKLLILKAKALFSVITTTPILYIFSLPVIVIYISEVNCTYDLTLLIKLIYYISAVCCTYVRCL